MPYFFAIRAIDFLDKASYTHVIMLRLILAAAIVLLAVGVILVGYNLLIIGTGLAGALALLSRYWRDFFYNSGMTQSIEWMTIIGVALMLAWRAGSMRETGSY
jgi:hypothetical protein